jgi:hypothetical protein
MRGNERTEHYEWEVNVFNEDKTKKGNLGVWMGSCCTVNEKVQQRTEEDERPEGGVENLWVNRIGSKLFKGIV